MRELLDLGLELHATERAQGTVAVLDKSPVSAVADRPGSPAP